jgi:16S rRNA (cytosine967-C5)-methyltransferase
MYFDRRLQQAEEVLKSYAYPIPFATHVKSYLQAHKNMGGRDRRELKELLYAYLRIARGLPDNLSKKEKLGAAHAFFHGEEKPVLDYEKLFPARDLITSSIDAKEFISSHLTQPLTWIYVKKDFVRKVETEFEALQLIPAISDGQTYGFEPETKLTETQGFKNGWFWVQDYSSQRTAEFFKAQHGEWWWDACAGAGGKSLAFREKYPDAHLSASDIRPSILENLGLRHRQVFGKKIDTFAADLTRPVKTNPPQFDGIIIDAPCTGSGTWARNPEHLLYFNTTCIPDFTKKQSAILENAWVHLKPGKPLIYITCSVFPAENEDVIDAFVKKEQPLVEEKRYIEGYRERAETMFICRMIKPVRPHA